MGDHRDRHRRTGGRVLRADGLLPLRLSDGRAAEFHPRSRPGGSFWPPGNRCVVSRAPRVRAFEGGGRFPRLVALRRGGLALTVPLAKAEQANVQPGANWLAAARAKAWLRTFPASRENSNRSGR